MVNVDLCQPFKHVHLRHAIRRQVMSRTDHIRRQVRVSGAGELIRSRRYLDACDIGVIFGQLM
jgi:hypothetical protein